jgi:hypothetical protein
VLELSQDNKFMNYEVILRTHGGLGNQLFQILYGRLYSESKGMKLREVHDLNYPHKFQRSSFLSKSEEPSIIKGIISGCRIPKIQNKFMRAKERAFIFGATHYIDGYYQEAYQYEEYSSELIKKNIYRLIDELKIKKEKNNRTLVHLRVGDFFKNREQAEKHVRERIKSMVEGASLMTNDESLLNSVGIKNSLNEKNIKLIETKNMPPEDVLYIMSMFSKIDANDSTLSIWSSILNKCEVDIKNTRLRKLRDYLCEKI